MSRGDHLWVLMAPLISMFLVFVFYKPLAPVQVVLVFVVTIPLGYAIKYLQNRRISRG
jgi:hypothetical protein